MRAGSWAVLVVASLAILGLDFATGPYIMFPIAFTLPVGLGAWYRGRVTGIAVAVVLVACRLGYMVFAKPELLPLWAGPVNAVIQLLVLVVVAVLVALVAEHQRRIKVLEGILPICAFCKKIRTEGRWVQMEKYITEHSEAQFSHGFCDACAREQYPEVFGTETDSPAEPRDL